MGLIATRIKEVLQEERIISRHNCRYCGTQVDFVTICRECLSKAIRELNGTDKYCLACGRRMKAGHICKQCATVLDMDFSDNQHFWTELSDGAYVCLFCGDTVNAYSGMPEMQNDCSGPK
jgi:hypothetical protein